MSQVAEQAAAHQGATRRVAFAAFWVLQVRESWWAQPIERRSALLDEAERALRQTTEGNELRAAYSLAGFRSDADLMLWWLGDDPGRFSEAAVALRQAGFGHHLEWRDVYVGLASSSQYTADHRAAFLRGEPPRLYASVYPFSKSPDWYLLPYEKRRELMAEHGRVGLEYPVATNTIQSFGLGDSEFVVALECDELPDLVACVEALRKVEVRRYTTVETPIYLGRRRELRELLSEFR